MTLRFNYFGVEYLLSAPAGLWPSRSKVSPAEREKLAHVLRGMVSMDYAIAGDIERLHRECAGSELDRHDLADWLYSAIVTGRLEISSRREFAVFEQPQAPPATDAPTSQAIEVHLVEIELIDEDGTPMAGERFRVELPDGTIREGSLDRRGRAYLRTAVSGGCQVHFPDMDGREWRAA